MAKYSIGIRLHAGYKAARTVKTNLKKSIEFIFVYYVEWSEVYFGVSILRKWKLFKGKVAATSSFNLLNFLQSQPSTWRIVSHKIWKQPFVHLSKDTVRSIVSAGVILIMRRGKAFIQPMCMGITGETCLIAPSPESLAVQTLRWLSRL